MTVVYAVSDLVSGTEDRSAVLGFFLLFLTENRLSFHNLFSVIFFNFLYFRLLLPLFFSGAELPDRVGKIPVEQEIEERKVLPVL